MKNAHKALVTALLLTGAAAGVPHAFAQLAGGGTGNSGGPIMYSADNMQADNTSHTVDLSGRVQLLQENASLQADHVKIVYSQAANSDKWDQISRIEATGKIYYVIDDQVMRGNKAVYTQSNDTMVVTGDVVLKQGQNVLTGERLTYVVGAKKSTIDGAPAGQSRGRVRGVFYPDGSAPATQP
ncbi:MAG: LptA/OstA family protein [Asticcacaulis sp.]